MELKSASKAGCAVCRVVVPQVILLALALVSMGLGVGVMSALPTAQPSTARIKPAPPSRAQIMRDYARLPLSFEPNHGQSAPQVKFLAHAQGYGLFLTTNQAVLLVRQPSSKPDAVPQFRRLSLNLLGANPESLVAASEQLPGVSNYLLGNDPRQWHTNVPHYARVHYHDIYPGVDLVYYGRQQKLEYDFVLSPGADPSRIQLQVRGAQALSIDDHGDLVLKLPGGAIQLRRPQVYQQADGQRQLVAARYVLRGDRVSFRVANYDRRRSLVIDPQLVYVTYLGGTLNEVAPAVAVDSAFYAYVAGTTNSPDFPTLKPFQSNLKGTTDVFVSKFNPAGFGLLFSTYLGGSGSDSAAGVALDGGFNVYVSGTTSSADFPVTTSNAFQTAPKAAGNHVFVTELNSAGGGPVYSSYLSGSGVDTASGVAVGPLAGTVYVTGTTTSSDFANVAKPAGKGTSQFFATKLDTSKQKSASLVYCTYIGGTTPAGAATDGGGIAVDSSGNAYITGGTTYTDMPVVNAPAVFVPNGSTGGAKLNGVENAFVAKLNPNGTLPALFLTYLGGNGSDIGFGVAADTAGNAYVTGSTSSSNFPVLAPAGAPIYQSTFSGTPPDAFVTKIASAGTSLIWSTYLGGNGADIGLGVAVDAHQNTFVTGSTTSTNLTTVQPAQAANGGGTDAFIAKFDISGNAQNGFVTYLGGSGNDRGTGVAVDVSGNPYVAGDTTTPTGLATAGAFQTALKGGSDAFVAHFAGVSDVGFAATPVTVTPNPVGIGNPTTFTFNIVNNGPEIATAVVLTDTLPSNGTFQSSTASQGTCSAPVGSTLVCSLGQIANGATATVTIQIAGTVAGPLSDTAVLSSSSLDPNPGNNSAGISATVNDFAVAVSPSSANVTDGQAATYTVTVGPVPQGAGFPNGVSLKCSGGVPTAAMCAFTTNPVTPNQTPVTSSFTISTTAPPPGTTASLFGRSLRRMYALALPLGGMFVLSFALVGDGRKRRRVIGIFALLLLLVVVALQPACSSSSSKPTVPPFTPAGTYNITVAAVSGTVTHTTTVSMVVH